MSSVAPVIKDASGLARNATAAVDRRLREFARALVEEHAAVEAVLRRKSSNGQTEGRFNRLKLLKRSIYGRAKSDPSRQRVLQAA
jgi:transposase